MERQDISGHLSGSEVLPRLDDAFDPTVSQRQVMTMHKYTPESIIDIYPCTPLQEDLMFLSLARPGTYIDRYLIYLHEGLSAERWIHSWQKVVAETPILRTKIIQRNEKEPLLQVVTSKVPDVPLVDQLDFYLSADQETPMGFGQPLHRIVRISNSKSSRACFVWTLHHAIYDGWSMDIILRGIQQTFTVGTVLQPAESFRHFIEYTAALDAVQSQNYWSNYLADTEPAFFPAPSAGLDGDVTRRSVSRNINMNKYGEFTLATYVKASWGILLASYNHTEDIVFACTVSGRDCPLVKIENIVGPTINVVPIRLDTRGSKKISELLYNVQRDAASSIPHQTLGLRNIQKLSSELRHVCDFNSLLIIQPKTITDFQDRKDIMELQPLNESSESVQYSLLLEVCQTADGLTVHLGFSTEVISKTQAYRIIGQFEHILAQLTIDQNQTLSSVGLLSSKDCANLVLYSKFRANLDESCIHLEINDQVNARPEALAVHSWDGDFSYKELSQASCQMAKVLLRNGLQAEQVVLLCFEKSKWTIVAALGVLMAGGTFCLLDIRDPSQRHHVIANITKAKIALTSPGFAGRLQGIVETILSVDARNLSKYDTNLPERPLPDVKAQQAAYIMFTSGSTGTPKGVAIEHRNFCYNSEQQRRVWNITNDTRFLQFASYSFTVSLIEIFTTLIGGGCVCVPSESERMEDLPSAVARLRATHACFTSSVLRTINPIEFPSLEFVMTSGEVVLQDDIRRWCDFVRLYQGYGQAECSPIVASTEMLTRESLPNCIGKPIGGRCWIVLPQDQNRLAPLGAIGELVVEGLHVGREYVNNPGKTREVFINHRRWTGEDIANKQGGWPMYRTGDLVRYGADGLLYYHGRKDFQVKVNGQRIELGEIESHLLQILDSSLDCAVDSIFVDSDGQRSMKLAAFVSIRDSRRNNGNPTDVGQNQREIIDRACQSASRDLKKLLSSYMIPSYYFALQYLPKTGSKKLDRKELRKMGGILAREFQKDRASSGILSIPESRLRKVWSRVLHIKEELIHSEDGFLQLGGDSLDAMRLSSEVRRNLQQQLSINSILKNCTLSAMAESMEPLEHEVIGSTPVLPFSLLSGDVGSIRNAASRACDVPLSAIEDIYPCTPMQQGLMALSSKHTGSYINQELFRLEKHVATTRMISSLKDVINAWPILRTRIVNIPHVGLVQVVIKEEITIPLSRNKKELVESYTDSTPSLGDRLSQFAICEGNSPGESFVLWRAHHAIYDAWSVNLLLQDIATCYETGQILLDRPSFATFVDHISREEVNTNAAQFWRSMLGDAQPTVFPFVIEPGYQARPDATVEYRFDVNLSDVGFTMSTILNAAWAILVEQYCGEEEAVIGITLSGRTQPCPSIEEIPGPTVVTIPLRVQTTNKNIRELLLEVQDQIVSAMPYQQYGLQKVMQLSESIHACCQFQTLFIVQAKAKPHGKGILSPYSSSEFTGGFTTHALLISCQLTESDSVELTATYDSNIITSTQISRLLEQFSHLARGLAVAAHCKEPSPYKDLRLISQHDTTQLKEWNQSPPPPVEDTIPSLIHQQSLLSPTSQAIDAWDGQMLYEDLDRLSDRLADHLVSALGVQTEDTIPLCFTKSMWVVVAMLGVLKSGARFTLLEVRNPSSRLDYLCRIVDAKLALAGEGLEDLVSGSVENVLTLNRSTVSRMEGQDQRSSRTVSPSNSAYVIFTSGSTGEPKGAIIEHRAFCSSAISQQKAFEINENTRFLQFASYSFGISLVDTLVTLISGGCICIPEQDELSQSLAGAIRRFNANTVFLTSTVMNLLEKDAVPSLHTLLSAGEPWNAHQIQYWGDHLRFVGGYGQSETAVISTSTSALTASESPSAQNIGRPIVGTAWITDRRNIDRLVPIGAVGELLLEGPQLGRGYLKNDSKTQEAFVSGLPWATQVGLRPDTRFYRTGDLARFAPDGCLEYIGRKDSQVKLHGQRVELGEVEHHLRKLSSYRSAEVAVEIITSDLNGRSNTVLGAFVSMKSLGLALDMNGCSKDPKALLSNNICVGALQEFSTAATELLYSELPGYMVPTVFLPIYELPLTVSGKLNRKKLREKGTELLQIQRQQEKAPAITEEPYSSLTEAEQTLRTLWGDVLQMRPETISADDHFLRLGGDSIAAMRLSSLALEHGISLLVSDIMSNPVLRQMAVTLQGVTHKKR